MPIPKSYRLPAVLPVILFVVSLLAARWYAGTGDAIALALGVGAAGASMGVAAWMIHTHARSIRTLNHHDHPIG